MDHHGCLSSVEYLSSVGKAVFQGLASDNEAVWLMQGWLFMFDQVQRFYSKANFHITGVLGHSPSGSTFEFSPKRTTSCFGS